MGRAQEAVRRVAVAKVEGCVRRADMSESSAPNPATFARSSRSRLTSRDLARFPRDTLFDRIGRAVCRAGCLPRKELFESWEMARRVRRVCRGGRIVDLAGGHGMLAMAMLLLDDSSPSAIVADPRVPPSAVVLRDALIETWPRLADRVAFVAQALDEVPLAAGDIVVASHACGALTDRLIARAIEARVPVAVLPCCHDHARLDSGSLAGWIDGGLAIDIQRVHTLEQHGYRVRTTCIPDDITPKNRLLIAVPGEHDA